MSAQSAPAQPSSRLSSASSQHGFDQIWNDALQRYKETTKRDFPLADDFPADSRDLDTVTEYIVQQETGFEGFRGSGKKTRKVLKPIVKVVLMFVDAGAEAAAAYNVKPGGKAIFLAVAVLLQAAKGVSKLYDEIESVLQQVKACLARVEVYLEPETPPNPTLLDVLVRTFVQVFIVLGVATKYCDQATDGGTESKGKKRSKAVFRRMKDYFRGILGDTEVQDAVKELAKLTNEEQLIVAAHTNAVVRQVKLKVDYLYHKAVIDDLSLWLDPPSPTPINHEGKRRAGSCEWFFDAQFEDWKAEKGGMYWLFGHAGAGKSIICSSVVDILQDDPELLLAYFYFDEGDSKKQDHRGLVSSLVHQIGTGTERGLGHLSAQRSLRAPTYDKLLPLLSQLLGLSGPTVIVIDALDECPERAREGLLHFLEHLRNLRSKDAIDIRVLVTGRSDTDIQNCLSSLATHTLNVNVAREHKEDIRNYVSTQLFDPESASFSKWNDGVKWRVYHALIGRSNGMFLWVVLQLQDLKHCAADDVERALDELPSDLDGTYERILKRFPSKPAMVARAHCVFECVAFSRRPLVPAEITTILSMDLKSLPPRVTLTSDVQTEDPEPIILRTCPRLLEIVSDIFGRKTVQFIHRSVKEYLTSPTLRQATSSPAAPYSFDDFSANLTLAKICLSMLIANGIPSGLHEYADAFWDEHVSPHNEDALSELLDSFLRMDSPAFARWVVARFDTDPEQDTAFHCATRLGLYRHVERMLKRSRRDPSTPAESLVETRNGVGETALHAAASWGHVKICRLLLEHGALVDDANDEGNTPLHIVDFEDLDSVHFLLQHPSADGSNAAALRCRTRNKKGRTPLHRAARSRWEGACRVLLEHGALVDDPDNNGDTPLHNAASSGYSDTVRRLLQYPAADGSNAGALRCRTRNKKGKTALHEAAHWGHVEVCRVLLEHGALVDEEDNDGKTPLQLAKENFWGEKDIAVLLEYGAKDVPDLESESESESESELALSS